jgi:predicted DNA-binding protein
MLTVMAKSQRSEENAAVLFVRQFPKGLLLKLKAAAALDGKTLAQYIENMCEAHVEELERRGHLPKGR